MPIIIDGGDAFSPPEQPYSYPTIASLLVDTLPRLIGSKPTGTTFYQAVNLISSLLARRLINRRSDLLKSDPTEWTVISGTPNYTLPSGFVALAEKPFTADGKVIEPLTKPRACYQGRTVTVPEAYELVGPNIFFYPLLDPLAPALTITARCYVTPSLVTSPADSIPFNGMFDQAYFQGVPRVIVKGLSLVQADGEFEALLNAEVETVLNARITPLPSVRTSRRNFL